MYKRQVFGITFEQERNELVIGDDFFSNVVTENKELPDFAKRDLAIAMIALKYTQSNSVCYVKAVSYTHLRTRPFGANAGCCPAA